jgi:nucleotide-binding universal stress UspA family protein
MNQRHAPVRIVVGIDGSDAAINAAKWAVVEATSRDIPLRLIHAIPQRQTDAADADESLDIEYGETSLRAACAALHATDEQVKLEAEIRRGSPTSVLIDESRDAAMLCIGSIGIGQVARMVMGSTAGSVAEDARCPVAVIRHNRQADASPSQYIAVVVGDSPDNDSVLEHGFREARLRNAPILAMGAWRWGFGEIPYRKLNRRLGRWVEQYPDVHVLPAAARHGVAEFLTGTQEPVQLAVIGGGEAGKIARMVGPIDPHFGHAGRSVLVVRN